MYLEGVSVQIFPTYLNHTFKQSLKTMQLFWGIRELGKQYGMQSSPRLFQKLAIATTRAKGLCALRDVLPTYVEDGHLINYHILHTLIGACGKPTAFWYAWVRLQKSLPLHEPDCVQSLKTPKFVYHSIFSSNQSTGCASTILPCMKASRRLYKSLFICLPKSLTLPQFDTNSAVYASRRLCSCLRRS